MKEIALVVPSIRQESFERFCREWQKTGLFDQVDLILIEDNPRKTFSIPAECGINAQHFSWEDIDAYEWANIIPRRSDTVRSFGYWWVWANNYKFLQTLDDDCYPTGQYRDLVTHHLRMMTRTRWFNTLNNVRPRGTPYYNLGKRDVYVNHGLWEGVLDYDAPQQLVSPVDEVYTHDNRIVPNGAYFSFCGMNAMWRREAIVLSYHMLMGYQRGLSIKFPFDRFGDIWSGIVAKKICDHLGWAVSSGTPYIHHDRASDPFTNLRKEANGIQVNEWFWEKIDAVELPSASVTTAPICYYNIGLEVQDFGGEHAEYWKLLGKAMMRWSKLFTE